jgi:hypothetical protein
MRFARLVVTGLKPLRLALQDLDLRDRRRVVVSFLYLAYVESFLSPSGEEFGELVRFCKSRHCRDREAPAPDTYTVLVDQVCWGVQVAAACFPRVRCLAEASATYLLLTNAGLPASLVIGVCDSEPGKLAAHAWVELKSEILFQETLTMRVYSPILRVGAHEW